MARALTVVAIALATACDSFDGAPSPSDDGGGVPSDDAAVEASADAGAARLSAVWAHELSMNDGGSVGASVAAAAGGDGVHVLFSGNGEIGGVVATDDAVLARIRGDGGLGVVSTHGGSGNQSARAVMADGEGRVFVSWLEYASVTDWRSYVRRVDVDPGSTPVVFDPGGTSEKDHLVALAPFSGNSYLFTGISGKKLLLGTGANNVATHGDGTNEALGLAAAGLGDGVVFAGRTASVLAFGNGCDILPASPSNAIGFLVKISNSLSCAWATALPASGASEASAVGARDAIVVAAGSFSGTFTPTGLTATNGIWLVRLDPQSGNVLWSRSFTSQGSTSPRAVAVDAQGRIVVVGTIATSVEIDGRTLAANGSPCGFVALFDSVAGTLLDAVRFGEAANVSAFSVAVGAPGEIYVGGTAYKNAALALPGASPARPTDRSFVARFAF